MKIHLQYAAFYNRAPFEKIELHFAENEIAVLTAVNGRGKTTILSHIVDAFHEMAKPFFPKEYEGKENAFYRLCSSMDNLDDKNPSLVYLIFKSADEDAITYFHIQGKMSEEEYNTFQLPGNKIQFSEIQNQLATQGMVKKISPNINRESVEKLFETNLLTYFPSYRFERPGYLNDPYLIELEFSKKFMYAGMLRNPIEVISGLPKIANWILDIVLDLTLYKEPTESIIFQNINKVLTQTLISKEHGQLSFAIGKRGSGSTRIQIIADAPVSRQIYAKSFNIGTPPAPPKTIYPSIFNLSSGEAAILCLFGEMMRQSDKNTTGITLDAVTGIVLIDEVDKHLHIKLQKEVLPNLFALFPNVQFIISSHSPFLSMGLAETLPKRAKIINLDNFGISTNPTTNELYQEVYQMMVGENENFKKMYDDLKEIIKNGTRPIIVTEGKTDVSHLKTAMRNLAIQDCDVDFFDITINWGDSELEKLLDASSKIRQTRKIIGIFDRDVPRIIKNIEVAGTSYRNYGNNVFAFCLPVPHHRKDYENISIEFYYTDEELKKEKDGKRLHFTNEFFFEKSLTVKGTEKLVKLPNANLDEELKKKIHDQDIGGLDYAHSKAVFADLVKNNSEYSEGFDFSNFNLIFEKVKEILNQNS